VPETDDRVAIYQGAGDASRTPVSLRHGHALPDQAGIEAGTSPWTNSTLVERYLRKEARRLMNRILKNCTWSVLIKTNQRRVGRPQPWSAHGKAVPAPIQGRRPV